MSAETCHRHLTRPAVEHCEVCRRPVCGSCLWYAESGERLCPDHAADFLKDGKTVIPPERYAEGIPHAEAAAATPAAASAPYQGNSTDISALLAAAAGVAGVLSCAGLYWILPFIAFVLGLVAWLQSRDAIRPGRTRWLAGVGLAGGGVFLMFFLVIFLGFAMCWLGLMATSLARPGGVTPVPFSTPIPFPTPTP